MIDKKDKLLNKLVKKDYNNLLEELLESKEYEEDVKSFILSMCYKIEIAYKDYEKVKKNVLPKDEYMKRIFLNIQKNCDNIVFIKKRAKKEDEIENINIDKEKKIISCYPIERILLYCLDQISKKDNIVKSENSLIRKAMVDMVNLGDSINVCEPLRDFNGFSWNIVSKDIENLIYNLLYQDLVLLNGNKFLDEWVNKNKFVINYWEKFENDIEEKYGNDVKENIINKIVKIAILQKVLLDDEYSKIAKDEKEKIETEYLKLKNSSRYLTEIANKKKILAKKIQKIDITINDKELLDMEYERRNEKRPLEKKIFSMKVLRKMMQEERKKMMEKLEEYTNLMNPQMFLKRQEDLKKYLEYFSKVGSLNLEKVVLENTIELQKDVLETFKIRINKAKDRQEIMKLMYELRYFAQIPISLNKRLHEVLCLKDDFADVEKILIKKGIEKKVMIEISNSENVNIEFLKNIFISKIICLENISIKVFKDKDFWKVTVFDEEIEESTINIEQTLEKNDLKVRVNKKVKIFI